VYGITKYAFVYGYDNSPTGRKTSKYVKDVVLTVELIPQELSNSAKCGAEIDTSKLIVEDFRLRSRSLVGCMKLVEEYATCHCTDVDGAIIMEMIDKYGLRSARRNKRQRHDYSAYDANKDSSVAGDFAFTRRMPESSIVCLANDKGCHLASGVLSNPEGRRYGPPRRRKRTRLAEEAASNNDSILFHLVPENVSDVQRLDKEKEYDIREDDIDKDEYVNRTNIIEVLVPFPLIAVKLKEFPHDFGSVSCRDFYYRCGKARIVAVQASAHKYLL